jgi:hypothetical protein
LRNLKKGLKSKKIDMRVEINGLALMEPLPLGMVGKIQKVLELAGKVVKKVQ